MVRGIEPGGRMSRASATLRTGTFGPLAGAALADDVKSKPGIPHRQAARSTTDTARVQGIGLSEKARGSIYPTRRRLNRAVELVHRGLGERADGEPLRFNPRLTHV